ncbi:hypothetical protein RHOSPDRAFT_33698 [Rhodotorula sp. JG-1b]|nr:hypothetical protein RHOSPDRAFT_33698 [Rhodotorula sp. JG-1b]
MFLAGSGGKGGAAVAAQPASAHHLDYAAGHAQFARQDPGPSGSYAAQSDYEYVQGGPTYAPPGYAEYRDRVPSSSSGSGFDHSRYAVAPHANLSHAPRQPSAGYHSYAAPYSNPADAQTMHDQAAWVQGGIAGQSPKLAPEMPPNRNPNPPSNRLPAGSPYLDRQPNHAHPPAQQMYGAYSDHLEPNQPTRTQPAVAQHEDGRSGASPWRPAEEPPRGYARNQSGPGYTANVRQEPAVPRQRYSSIPEENYRPAPRQDFSHPLAPTSPLKPNSAKLESAERSFHTYLFDYLTRAGFHSAASAFLAEAGPVENHDPRTGQPLFAASANSTSSEQPRASADAGQFAPHPTFENGGQAYPPDYSTFSPRLATGRNVHGQPDDGATPSSATTASHFGFNGEPRRDSESGSWGTPSSRNSLLPGHPPQDSDRGFLYDWFSVFWDVYSAQARSATPVAGGRSFVRASSAAVEMAMRQQQVELNAARFGAALRAPPIRSLAPTARAPHPIAPPRPPEPSMRPPIPLRRSSMPRVGEAAQGPSAALQQRAQQAARAAAEQAMLARQQAERRGSLADEVVPTNGPPLSARRPSRTGAGPVTTTSTPYATQYDDSATPSSQGESPARQANGTFLRKDAASSRPAFSPEALQYHPEQLQQTAEAYQRYRASLVAKQTSQLELAKRQLSVLSGDLDGAKKVEEVGRPATMVHSPAANAMPPPLSTSRQTSAHSTPSTHNVTLPSEPVGAGQRENHTDSARTAAPAGGKRRRGSEATTENLGTDGKRRNVDRPGSSGSEGAATSTPTDSRAEPQRRGNIETHKDYTVEPPAAVAQDRSAEYNASSDETSFGQRDVKETLPAEDMTLEQLSALLSSSTDPVSERVDASKPLEPPPIDAAAFDYDEFLSSFGGPSGALSYDPTQAFDLSQR